MPREGSNQSKFSKFCAALLFILNVIFSAKEFDKKKLRQSDSSTRTLAGNAQFEKIPSLNVTLVLSEP